MARDKQRARMQKADALLILKRAERRDSLELPMEGGHAQGCHFGKRLDADLLGKFRRIQSMATCRLALKRGLPHFVWLTNR